MHKIKLVDSHVDLEFSNFLLIFEKYEISETNQSVLIKLNKCFNLIRLLLKCSSENIIQSKSFKNLLEDKSLNSITSFEFLEEHPSTGDEKTTSEIIKEIFKQSKLLKHEKDTIIIQLPLFLREVYDFDHDFKNSYSVKNIKDEQFLILTNNKSIINFYEKI